MHLWESAWWRPLAQLSPRSIQEGRGNFGRLMSHVLGPNVALL
jgi:hypothetical protein